MSYQVFLHKLNQQQVMTYEGLEYFVAFHMGRF